MGEKQQWSNEHIKCLLETCIEEINNVGKKGLSLHKDLWNKLGIVLKDKFGMVLTQKQMKNAFDNLKAKYVGCLYLSFRNTHVNVVADEDEVEANGTASDREYMTRLRDEIADKLMQNMES
ncbi:hypothetical protein R6Q57_020587 [Mikania cordata]